MRNSPTLAVALNRGIVQFFECRSECIRKTPDGSRPKFLVLWLEVEVMHAVGKVFGSFESTLDECLVDNHLRTDVRQFASLQGFLLFPHRLEVSLHSVNAHRMQSMSENDFECFTSTGVNTSRMAKTTDGGS
jgi:hypothetical protein